MREDYKPLAPYPTPTPKAFDPVASMYRCMTQAFHMIYMYVCMYVCQKS